MIKVAKQLKVGPTEQFNTIYKNHNTDMVSRSLHSPVMARLAQLSYHVYMTIGEISKQNKEQ